MTEIKIGNVNDIKQDIETVAKIGIFEIGIFEIGIFEIEELNSLNGIKITIHNVFISSDRLTLISSVMESYGYKFEEVSFDIFKENLLLFYLK